jgi:anti-sigma factor RsiW
MFNRSNVMNCETAKLMIETNDPALQEHLLSCIPCIMRTRARYYEAPPGLERNIRQSLREETSTQSRWRPSGWQALHWQWMAIAASILLVASLIGNVVMLRSRVDQRQMLASNILSAHVRSLAGTHLLDVPSSDQHTVKPWFNGKLDFAPPVKDVEGFPLLGGRLEYFDGRPAAALIYGRRNHIINLFTWPSATPTAEAAQTINGYHLESWSSGGMTFWAVSDLNETELRQFVSLYRR